MKYSKEAKKLITNASLYCIEQEHLYLMPEHLLYALSLNMVFVRITIDFGGQPYKLQKQLRTFLRENAGHREKKQQPIPSVDYNRVLIMAGEQAANSGHREISTAHILFGIMSLNDSFATYFLSKQDCSFLEVAAEMSRQEADSDKGVRASGFILWGGTDPDELKNALSNRNDNYEIEIEWQEEPSDSRHRQENRGSEKWKAFTTCLNEACRNEAPLIGREEELARTIQVLCRMNKNNVLHIGEPGVGKTALVMGLAQKINEGDVPWPLKEAEIYSIDMGSLVAGTQYRGDFEKRFKAIMEGLSSVKKPIVYLDEIHTIVGAGAAGEGSLDASNMLKPYLSAGNIRFIGATTYEEFKKHLSNKKSLVRRFQQVVLNEPSIDEAVKILTKLRSRYEDYHQVCYREGIIEYIVNSSSRFIHERFLPDKAIDLMDEAGAFRKLNPSFGLSENASCTSTNLVDEKIIDLMLSKTCQIPAKTLENDDLDNLITLEERIASNVFGQSEAVQQVASAVKFSKAGLLEAGKPLASLLFVGPTGVGKTETAKSLADELGISLIRFDMSEYAEKHTIAKLIGAPAGYVGYEEGGLLTEEIRKKPHAVLLLDEIEKAHPDIYNVLLQIMDYATLTDNQGRKADFSNIILIMTSNAGAFDATKEIPGFGTHENTGAIMDAVKRTFQPEFRNRLQKIVAFNPMDDAMAMRITKKKIRQLSELLKEKNINLTASPEALKYIKCAGITKEYGARQIDRVINQEIKPLLADRILFGDLRNGGNCRLDIRENVPEITKEETVKYITANEDV